MNKKFLAVAVVTLGFAVLAPRPGWPMSITWESGSAAVVPPSPVVEIATEVTVEVVMVETPKETSPAPVEEEKPTAEKAEKADGISLTMTYDGVGYDRFGNPR